MVRKTQFTREDVVAAAMAVVERTSLAGLTARGVADELGASTAPVYSNFPNMEALVAEVKARIAAELLAGTRIRHTENEFLNMGLGVLEFARSRPGLYCAMFLGAGGEDATARDVMEDMLARMATVPELADLPAVERLILLRKMAIFTHGLATQLCGREEEKYTWPEVTLLLREVGEAMVKDAYARGRRNDGESLLLGRLCAPATLSMEGPAQDAGGERHSEQEDGER